MNFKLRAMDIIVSLSFRRVLLLSVLLCLCACASGKDDDEDSGLDSFSYNACDELGTGETPKLIGGELCIAGNSPVLKVVVSNSLGESRHCTGTAIDERHAITSARCVDGMSKLFLDSGVSYVKVSKVMKHPDYKFKNGEPNEFNLAVLEAGGKLKLRTLPILASRRAVSGEEGLVAGYGVAEDHVTGLFRTGNSFVTGISEDFIRIHHAGRGSDPTAGDFGGPLFLNHNGTFGVAGILVGTSKLVPDNGVHTYLNLENPELRSWIISKVEDTAVL